MLSQNKALTSISSEQNQNISYKRKNNTYKKTIENKLIPNNIFINDDKTNKDYNSSQRTFNSKKSKLSEKRLDSPNLLNDELNKEQVSTEKIKQENNQLTNTKNLKKNTIVEKYKLYIQRLRKFLKSKEEEINSLKEELQKIKTFNKNNFYNLDIGGMGLNILAPKKEICESSKNSKYKYKIQFLDQIEIFNENINGNINIETRDSIEIFPTIKTPLKAQKVNEMLITPLKRINYIQILDQLSILKDNALTKNIKIEERDSIEIFPTIKTLLKAQKVSQLYIKSLGTPEFLIQNLDRMIIIKENKKEHIIESRTPIEIFSEERTPLKAQHTENMFIISYKSDNYRKPPENNEILKTPKHSNYQKLRNSIEQVTQKKSPLKLKNSEDLKNKYLKKYRSENNDYTEEKNCLGEDKKILSPNNEEKYKPKLSYRYNKCNNVSIRPTLKVQDENVKTKNNLNNHKLEEISYKNKKYNIIIPKPSILPLSKTTKNINTARYENRRNKNVINIINENRKEYNNNYPILRKSNINERANKNNEQYENEKGRNVKIIRTQKNGPSIIEKKYIAHSCEKYNNLNFKKNNSIRDNFHEVHSINN